ncbi:chaperone protein DnaJ [Luteitalea pratensis]|uniref:Chaperone protein DnaJ n=2 Tax=Luteitalea pratensis TaxID=1855912 RepID=A0A143PVQ2_LUTPR|nr:chaperone protein DnaJ [Luteitalea pratensis]
MHDYYRIAEISGATRRAPARAVPAWAVVAHAMPASAPRTPPQGLHLVRALEPERPVDGALRDEVALDFPSGQQAIDHARRDFAEADGPAVRLLVDVTLTPLEARRSKRVPLCVHVPALCDACGGRGEAWDEPCAACEGVGTAIATRYLVVRVPANTVNGTTLRYRLALPYGPLVRLDVRLAVR